MPIPSLFEEEFCETDLPPTSFVFRTVRVFCAILLMLGAAYCHCHYIGEGPIKPLSKQARHCLAHLQSQKSKGNIIHCPRASMSGLHIPPLGYCQCLMVLSCVMWSMYSMGLLIKQARTTMNAYMDNVLDFFAIIPSPPIPLHRSKDTRKCGMAYTPVPIVRLGLVVTVPVAPSVPMLCS